MELGLELRRAVGHHPAHPAKIIIIIIMRMKNKGAILKWGILRFTIVTTMLITAKEPRSSIDGNDWS